MKGLSIALVGMLLVFANSTVAQHNLDLSKTIDGAIAGKKATVGIMITDANGKNVFSRNENARFPMQSVFKLHIGLLVLSEVDKGNYTLDQKFELTKEDMIPDLYSPIREEYPDGATLSLGDILKYTIADSDNVGCEFLLKKFGGPQAIENYFRKLGFKNVAIKHNEQMMQANWNLQFENWTTPKAANEILQKFYDDKRRFLSKSSHDFFWRIMRETTTGANRIKGNLPEGTIVAHKTGSSGVNKTSGITAAVNDTGIVFLPNGDHFFITVFVTDSKEDVLANEKIVADIAKAAWDYFIGKTNTKATK